MPAELTPYPAYKPSAVPWLGDVPEHWEVRRLRTVANVLNGATPSTNVPAYWDGEILWVTPEDLGKLSGRYIRASGRRISSDGYRSCGTTLAPAWSVAISTRAPIGHLGILTSDGCVNQGCRLLVPCPNVESEYLHYALSASREDLAALGQGSTFTELSRVHLASSSIPLPPLPEQTAIVRYLDHVDRRIRRYVSAKRKLIALLAEERQAVVSRAVTRGLDPSVALKPSGIEWLGDVPAHWQVVPVKRAFLSIDYGISESASDSGAIRLLTMGHLKDGQVIMPNDGGVDFVAPHLLLQKGDLLFNRTNSQELVGKVGLFIGHDTPVTFASYLVRMRPHPSHEPEYLNMALNDASFISRARREAIPSLHQSNLNPTRFGRIHIALPSNEEQIAILRTLREKTASLGAAIAAARRLIDLLQEYRTRLISDVVTGKLDVRAAAQLPDEAEEPAESRPQHTHSYGIMGEDEGL